MDEVGDKSHIRERTREKVLFSWEEYRYYKERAAGRSIER